MVSDEHKIYYGIDKDESHLIGYGLVPEVDLLNVIYFIGLR